MDEQAPAFPTPEPPAGGPRSASPPALVMPARAAGEVLWQIALGVVRRPLRFPRPVPWR